MSKVYIVKVQGWGDDEDAFYNISGHSTRKLADKALKELLKQAKADGLDDVVTDVEVLSIDA
jgi:hydroxylamine reductase (hybrid-cluster protein)